MTPYERLHRMIAGEDVDRPGISVWKHFFLDDRYVQDHVRRTIAFQDMGNWDFIKIMTTNVHMEAAYGSKIKWTNNEGERTLVVSKPLKSPKEIAEMGVCDVTTGPLHKEVEVARILSEHYKGKVPVLGTVDTPASYLKALYCGFEDPARFTALIRDYPEEFKKGLETMTKVCVALAEEYVKAGVDGIFIATNIASELYMTEQEYMDIVLPSELAVAEAVAGKTWFNVLHLHGNGNVFFDQLVNRMPVQAVNWHTVTSSVSMEEAAKKTDKILIGGLDHMSDFSFADRAQLDERLRERVKLAVESVPANRLIVATGCSVIPPNIPDARISRLTDIVEEICK